MLSKGQKATDKVKHRITSVVRSRHGHYGKLFPISENDDLVLFDTLANLRFHGDLIPHSWHNHIVKRMKNGQLRGQPLAALVLGRIVFKYRPHIETTDHGEIHMMKRFPEDRMWYTSYHEIGLIFPHYSKKQLRDVLNFLEDDLNVIRRHHVSHMQIEVKQMDDAGNEFYEWQDFTNYFGIELNWNVLTEWTEISYQKLHGSNGSSSSAPTPPTPPTPPSTPPSTPPAAPSTGGTPKASKPNPQPKQKQQKAKPAPAAPAAPASPDVQPFRSREREPLPDAALSVIADCPDDLATQVSNGYGQQFFMFPNPMASDYEREWLQPAKLILEMVGRDVQDAIDLAVEAHNLLLTKKMHPKSMAGLLRTATMLHNQRKVAAEAEAGTAQPIDAANPYAGLNQYTI